MQIIEKRDDTMNPNILPNPELQQHLLNSYNLDKNDIPRLLEDIIGFFDKTLEEYVQWRHRHLKAVGLKNKEIYERLQLEIEGRRFKAPSLSLRQVRRIIYG